MVEWLLRHTLPFLLIVGLVRWLVWPRFGKNGVVELLLINAVGDLAAHAAFEEQHPLVPSLGGIVLWLLMIAGLGAAISRSKAARRWLGYFDQAVEIARDGMTDDAAMRRQRVSRSELESELRQQSIQGLAEVSCAGWWTRWRPCGGKSGNSARGGTHRQGVGTMRWKKRGRRQENRSAVPYPPSNPCEWSEDAVGAFAMAGRLHFGPGSGRGHALVHPAA